MKNEWKACCKKEIARVWGKNGSPMNIVWYQGKCPECKHFIGLTQTSQEDAESFIKTDKQATCTHCDCRFAPVENNQCPCECHKVDKSEVDTTQGV